MKSTIVLAVLLATLAVPVRADTTWVEIGTNFRGNAIPFWGANYDAMRFQTLYHQSDINYTGEIVAFGLMTYSTSPPAAFYNVRVKLCLTGSSKLKTDFASNYGGNQPQTMLEKDTLIVGTPNDWYYFPCSFEYNNVDNLLLEIAWRGDAGRTVNFYRNGNGDTLRAWAYDNDTASVGMVDNVEAYHARIGFLPTGVSETGPARLMARLTAEPTFGRRFRVSGCTGTVRVLDAAGRIAGEFDLGAGPGQEWDAAGLPAGVYLLRAEATRAVPVVVTGR